MLIQILQASWNSPALICTVFCFLFFIVWCWMSSIQVFHSSSLILSEEICHLISPVFGDVWFMEIVWYVSSCNCIIFLPTWLYFVFTQFWKSLRLVAELSLNLPIDTNIFMLYCFKVFNFHPCFLIFQNLISTCLVVFVFFRTDCLLLRYAI